MSIWTYDTNSPPVKAHDVPDAFAVLLGASGLFGTLPFLSSLDHIYAHEEPVDKPADGQYLVLRTLEPLGGQKSTSDGEVLAQIHLKVAGEKTLTNYRTWHRAMHDRCDQALLGKTPSGLQRATASVISRETEPSQPRYYQDSDTRESFAIYAVRLVAIAL